MRAAHVGDRLHYSHRAPTSETPPRLVALLGWSEGKEDGSADAAAGCLGEHLVSVGEGAIGSDRFATTP
jgi:hypothetical protein